MNERVPPKVYTIAAERPFLDTLAGGLLEMTGGDPLGLPRVNILLPTRRAVRALREAFLRAATDGRPPGKPLLLPRMRPVGGIDSDELILVDGAADGESLAMPPAIPELRRRLLLTQLVIKWGRVRGQAPLLPGQAAALAGSLARFLDTVATEGASFARLADLVPQELAAHWQIVHKFLEILPSQWPQILAEEGALDPAVRRNRLLQHQAALWRRSPPRDPVIAAGLTGGIPAVTELLSAVAELDHGAVILPGLDRRCEEAEWRAIECDEAHPQYLMALLLKALGVAPREVRDWPPPLPRALVRLTPSHSLPRRRGRGRVGAAGEGLDDLADLPLFAPLSRTAGERARARRVRLVGEALRPAATTDAWRRLPAQMPDTFDGVSRFDCASAQQEAVTIALLLRRKLETPGATAALVTPDRELARRVAAELRRWGIEIDDSAGVPLNRTPPGAFLRLVLELAASGLAPVPLLAALKHPLAAGGLAPARFRDRARRLEEAILGPRPAPGIDGLRAALREDDTRLHRFVDRLNACLGRLPELLAARCGAARPSGDSAYRGGRAARRECRRGRRQAALGRRGGRVCGTLLPRADRGRPRLPAALRPRLPRPVGSARRRHGRAARLRPPSAAGDLGARRGAPAAGRPHRPRRAQRGELAGLGRARPVDVAADAARLSHRRSRTLGRHHRA